MGLLMPGCLQSGTGGLQSPRYGTITSFEPWIPPSSPDLHGFYKWVMDALAFLNEFVLKVVHCAQTTRLQAWSNWIREDLTPHLPDGASWGINGRKTVRPGIPYTVGMVVSCILAR